MRPILELKDIHQIFGKDTINENHVLRGLNLSIHEGDFVSIIGGNGAGKSTLLNTIAGTYVPYSGQILLEGRDITYEKAYVRARDIARVFQDPQMGTARNLTIEENMAIANKRGLKANFSWGVKDKDRKFFQDQLKILGLNLENRLKTPTGLLSGGQRQALTLLMAVLQTPKLLLLDEHTAALDPKTVAMVMELTNQIVTERQLTAFMITHNMEDAIKYGNRLIMLHQGQIAVDIAGEDKKNLTVNDLLDLFHQKSGTFLSDDHLLLSS